jgi:hypothetical protein
MNLQTLLFVGILAVLLAACFISFMHGKRANMEILGQKVLLSSLIIGGLLLATVGVLMSYTSPAISA